MTIKETGGVYKGSYTAICDGCGKKHETEERVYQNADKDARDNGWLVGDDAVWCPDCYEDAR